MVRRGSTVRVRQRASRDPAWLLGCGSGGHEVRVGSSRMEAGQSCVESKTEADLASGRPQDALILTHCSRQIF
jgi:hypothetical protein